MNTIYDTDTQSILSHARRLGFSFSKREWMPKSKGKRQARGDDNHWEEKFADLGDFVQKEILHNMLDKEADDYFDGLEKQLSSGDPNTVDYFIRVEIEYSNGKFSIRQAEYEFNNEAPTMPDWDSSSDGQFWERRIPVSGANPPIKSRFDLRVRSVNAREYKNKLERDFFEGHKKGDLKSVEFDNVHFDPNSGIVIG